MFVLSAYLKETMVSGECLKKKNFSMVVLCVLGRLSVQSLYVFAFLSLLRLRVL